MTGLSNKEAAERLKTYGYNELPAARPKNLLRIASESLKEPMFLLLLICASLYTLLGDYYEGGFMLLMVLLIISITFYQYHKTEKALDALKRLSSPRALVLRDGKEIRIPGREVVPGDLIIVGEGDRIAADACIVETVHLSVDESMLTGESVPVSKSASGNPQDKDSMLFSGSMVTHGKARAIVQATGIQTALGRIGSSLEQIEDLPTHLQTEMKRLIQRLFAAGMLISASIVLLYYLNRGNFISALLNGMAAAMAVLPEEFPMVLTVFLALGAWRLSRIRVLTRKPSVIETLGSATVLCSDKTGTITLNHMRAVALYDGHTLYKGSDIGKSELHNIHLAAMHACQDDPADPMEKALLELHSTFHNGVEQRLKLLKEYPFTRELTAMSRAMFDPKTSTTVVYMKGAPETVFDLCRMSPESISGHKRVLSDMAGSGLRVLGLGKAIWNSSELPVNQSDFAFEFTGFTGLEDPIRPEVPSAVQECRDAGVRVIMITGDYPLTASSIARQAGIADHGMVLSGTELNAMGDEELTERIGGVAVFARVVPEQKLRIVRALQARGETVAMTGDGVNDAPALKAAHIGIAMGMKGTDVAREASSIVLLDDNFASIVSAMRMGRKIYDNLQKAMSYILAVHIPIIGLTLMPAFFADLPVLLLPVHIIFMELIIDPVCSVAFESEQEEKDIMSRKPRNTAEAFFGFRKIAGSLFQGMLLLLMVLLVYAFCIRSEYSPEAIRAISFSALVAGNMALILSKLSRTRSVLSVLAELNWSLVLILSSGMLILLALLFVPPLQNLFGFEHPGLPGYIPAVTGALGLLVLLELQKLVIRFRKV